MAIPTLDDTYCRVDVLEKILSKEAMTSHSMHDPLKVILLGRDVISTETGERNKYVRLFNASTARTPQQCPKEIINTDV